MISFVIPTINEEINIFKTLNSLIKLKKKFKFDVIIVDDNSSDKTLLVANSFKKKLNLTLILNSKAKGLGYALMLGFKKSKKKIVIFLDADLSISKFDLIKLINLSFTSDIIIGSRYLNESKIIGAPKLKIFFSKYLNKIISYIFETKILDMSHSFRSIKKDVRVKSKNFSHPGFFWEMTINAHKMGYKIKEIPITFYDRKYGKTKNNTLKMLKSILDSLKNLIFCK